MFAVIPFCVELSIRVAPAILRNYGEKAIGGSEEKCLNFNADASAALRAALWSSNTS